MLREEGREDSCQEAAGRMEKRREGRTEWQPEGWEWTVDEYRRYQIHQ